MLPILPHLGGIGSVTGLVRLAFHLPMLPNFFFKRFVISMVWISVLPKNNIKTFITLHRKSKDIDCSRLFIGRFYEKKHIIFTNNNFNIVGNFASKFNAIFLNSNPIKKLDEDDYISLIPIIISHESLHMVIDHIISSEASIYLDNFLQKINRDDVRLLDISGL